MKIRSGFVSNSSSSSFVLVFPNKPRSVKEVQELLWPGQDELEHPYKDEPISTRDAARAVFDQIRGQRPMTKKQLGETFEHHVVDRVPYDYDAVDRMSEKERQHYWDVRAAKVRRAAQEKAADFLKQHPDKEMFRVSFSDNDGSFGAAMEHGGFFGAVPHVCTSHH